MTGYSSGSQNDPVEAINEYLESPGRFKPRDKWRARVQYRCKRSHTLGFVVKLPTGLVLYTLRREGEWQADEPTDMVGPIPALDEHNGDFEMAIGGCKCQSVRTRRLAQIWADIERGREARKQLEIRV